MKIRRGKKTDQKQTQKAYELLCQLAEDHPEIEETLWFGALFSAAAEMYIQSNLPYEEFCRSLDELKVFYKQYWEPPK
jgi:hypothetical protein